MPGAAQTTLYALDVGSSALARIGGAQGAPSPNGGVATTIGPVGVSLLGTAVGLDFAADGTLFAAFRTVPSTGPYALFTINTFSGAATLVGVIGTGEQGIESLAAVNGAVFISPGTGIYTSQQRFDLVVMIDSAGRSLVSGNATFEGFNVTGSIVACAVFGHTAGGLTTVRCPNLGGPLFGAGNHTLIVNIALDNGTVLAGSAVWMVLPSSEP